LTGLLVRYSCKKRQTVVDPKYLSKKRNIKRTFSSIPGGSNRKENGGGREKLKRGTKLGNGSLLLRVLRKNRK